MTMDMSVSSENVDGPVRRAYRRLAALPGRFMSSAAEFGSTAKKIGKEDPRRIVHGIKVAMAITLVSIFYYFQPLYDDFGTALMWAVLTVVVVFEYTVGATLGKGINRMIATFVAGLLGSLVYHLANLSGHIGKPILLSTFCFIAAASVTFMRFFPKLKARYDYGLMIFILTFSLVTISGYREDEVVKIAHQRLSTIIVGSFIAMIVCICVCPVWNGEELHKLISSNLDKLGNFLQDFGECYFHVQGKEGKSNKDVSAALAKYKSILGCKSTEENMANLATWEPPHGRFRFRHPWKQYLKVGALARQCAYTLDSLNNCLNSNSQAAPEIRVYIQEACTTLSSESGRALKELATCIKKMKRPSSAAITHVNKSKQAVEDLKSLLNYKVVTHDDDDDLLKEYSLLDLMPAVTVASLLIDVGNKLEEITEAVHELSSLAKFKSVAADKAVTPLEGGDEEKEEKGVMIIEDVVVGNEGKEHLSDEIELNELGHDHVVININGLVSHDENNISMEEIRKSSVEKKNVDEVVTVQVHTDNKC